MNALLDFIALDPEAHFVLPPAEEQALTIVGLSATKQVLVPDTKTAFHIYPTAIGNGYGFGGTARFY